MPLLRTTFSSQITGYFGALFLAAVGILSALWYFGLPAIGLVGASSQRMVEAVRLLELRANQQHGTVAHEIGERRGDLLVIAENKTLAKQLALQSPLIQQNLVRVFDRLQRAYPDRYQRLLVVDPANGRIRASSAPRDLGHPFDDPELIQRASQTGATELVVQLAGPGNTPGLAVVRQVHAPDADGYPSETLVGILIAYIDLQQAIGNGLQEERSGSDRRGATLLFDPAGQILARFPNPGPPQEPFRRSAQVAPGFEGTLVQTDTLGRPLVVVYRHLSLSGSQGWTLVHYASQDDALGALKESINALAIAGLFLTLAALVLIHLVARRLTQPLGRLAQTARRLGAGDLAVRAQPLPYDSREVAALSDAFSSMAEGIQRAQLTLEAKVQERTAELERVAAHLRQSEESLAITLQSIGDAVIATDATGHITRMNTTAERLTGWPLAEALGQPLPTVFHIVNAQTRLRAVNPVQMVMERGEVVGLTNHTALLARGGQEYQISDSAAPIRDPLGSIVGVVLVFSDVTEDYRVREALVNTAELLKHTGELAKVGGWELDLQTMKFHWASETFRIHEMDHLVPPTLEESIDLFVPEARPIVQAAVRAAREYGTPYDLELQKFTAKGRRIWVRIQGFATVENGKTTKLYGVLHDITQRREAEANLRIAAIAFESQEGMFVTDADWVILRVNRAFTEITGYSADEAVGQMPDRLLGSERHDAAFYDLVAQSVLRSGSWQGEVWDRRKTGDVFPLWVIMTAVKADDGAVTHYVATMTDITQRKAAEDQIKSLAFYDPLTQLPNRRLLMNRLEKAMVTSLRNGLYGALLFVDLDNFKTLNDTLGHDKGDLLLQQVATRLRTCIRGGDSVARLGGDEFVVMLEDLSAETLEAVTQAETVGEKILTALNEVYQLGNYAHHSTPSIGVTLFGEAHESIDEPLKRADLAMYQAKAAGRNTLRFFDPQMQAVVTARASLEAGLREALVQGQFVLYYQGQVSGPALGPVQFTGAEALVRWNHPQRGMVPPGEFIPLAEETGLILPLGQWVLDTACRQLATWALRPSTTQLTLAVNVSASQFHQVDFVDRVVATLARTGANPQRLKLELTEGLLVSNVEDIITKMGALKAHGVRFSLDDFGTGYSSLSYLKRLPLSQLKIDQCFVRDILIDPNDAAIAKMIIVLAESLGLSVMAEGIETEAQSAFLASQGCHSYQGYLFSRPVPIAEFESLLKDRAAPG